MEDIIIEEEQSKLLRLGFLGIIITIIAIAECAVGVLNHKPLIGTIGVIGTIFFGCCTIYLYSRAFRSKPLLTIAMDGVYDSSSAGAIGYIPYSEIQSFEISNVFGQRMIGIQLKNENRFLKQLTPMKQKTAYANIKMKVPPITLRVDTARDMSIEDIVSLLKKRLSDHRSLYD